MLSSLRNLLPRPRRAARPKLPRWKPSCETLEDRVTPSITIQIDYSHDGGGFFSGHADRQALLQTAANNLSLRLGDALSAITPGGSNTWSEVFDDPGTGNQDSVSNPSIAANTIIVYAGGRNLGTSVLGLGGPGGFSASGTQSWLNTVEGRGQAGALGTAGSQTDFGPWGGSVSFNTNFSNWFFGTTISGIQPNQVDFLSVAEHELGHVLGFGTANSWENRVSGSTFTGPTAVTEFGGDVPTDAAYPNAAHWANGTTDHGATCTMDPVATNGARTTFTKLDFCGLQDLGWQVEKTVKPLAGTTPQSTPVNTAFPTALAVQVLDFAGNPVSGVTVTFKAPTSGASGTFTGGVTTVTATTDSSGNATAPTFTANGTTGSYTVTASVKGVPGKAKFALTNSAGAAAPGRSATTASSGDAGATAAALAALGVGNRPVISPASQTSATSAQPAAVRSVGDGANASLLAPGDLALQDQSAGQRPIHGSSQHDGLFFDDGLAGDERRSW
jgi:hypothetical protein